MIRSPSVRPPDPLSEGLERELRALDGPDPRPTDPARIKLLLSLYSESPQTVLDLLNRFLADRRCSLKCLYRAYRYDQRPEQVARAPEALLMLERLEHDSDRLQDLWRKHLPLYELEQAAAFYGIPL